MKRKASALALLAALGGCVSADKTGPVPFGGVTPSRTVAGVQGPFGEPVPVVASRPRPVTDPKATVVQASATAKTDGDIVQANYKVRKGEAQPMLNAPPGAVAAVGALPGIPMAPGGMRAGMGRSSIRFTSPAGMQIAWFAPSPDGRNGFTPTQVEVPGRYNFVQCGIYRLKLSNIPNRPSVELYPTLEVMPASARTATFLAHSTVPVSFTEEDFEQVAAGNLVVKVIYLPDPQFQDLAVAGPDEVVSTRLEPGVDPILEAQRRGAVLAVVRMGNIDLEAPNTPPLSAPPQGGPMMGMPGGPQGGPFQGMPLMPAPGSVPPGMMPPGGQIPLPAGRPGTMPPPAAPMGVGEPTIKLPDSAGAKNTPSVTGSVDAMIVRTK
jgi:hypothetical protein